MSVILRIFLFIGAFGAAFYIIYKVRKEKVKIENAIYWVAFSAILFLLSVFPSISYTMSDWLQIQSPSNFVFLFVIFLLMVKLFSNSIKLSHLEYNFAKLTQNMAILEKRLRYLEKSDETPAADNKDAPTTTEPKRE